MIQSERVYQLENQTFMVSKNVNNFPVQFISFSSLQSHQQVKGVLHGEGISSGKFTGRFIATDQVELFFSWFDLSLSHVVAGKIFAFLCGGASERMRIFLNWYCLFGRQGYGAASYNQLQSL